ncbi:integrase-like protein [Shimia abyssi]|uniref:Integrase-like protein n=1 Tax=Shimia abyssi TaxID=1662395 RepID=A0A2P8F7A7_9RHOB|nr:integrase-like protein [Shimia abyssi]
MAESFFQLLKRERIRRRIYPTREDARRDVFEYIELFYNPKRKHTNNGMLSPPITHALHVLPGIG